MAASTFFTTRDLSQSFFKLQESLSKWLLGGAIAIIYTIVTDTQVMFDSYNIYFIKISLVLCLISMYQGFKNIFGHQLQKSMEESESFKNYLTRSHQEDQKKNDSQKINSNEIEHKEAEEIMNKLIEKSVESFFSHIKRSRHLLFQILFFNNSFSWHNNANFIEVMIVCRYLFGSLIYIYWQIHCES